MMLQTLFIHAKKCRTYREFNFSAVLTHDNDDPEMRILLTLQVRCFYTYHSYYTSIANATMMRALWLH